MHDIASCSVLGTICAGDIRLVASIHYHLTHCSIYLFFSAHFAVKHARLAMLAAAGWPLSEVFDKKIAAALNLPAVVDAADRAPSLLNGGLGKVNPAYWVACLALAGAVDAFGIMRSKGGEYATPGDLGFDPIGAYPKSDDGRKWMETAEIKNGRLAMVAIFAFAIQEAVSQVGVVNETPLFFFPLVQTLKEYANSGYIN